MIDWVVLAVSAVAGFAFWWLPWSILLRSSSRRNEQTLALPLDLEERIERSGDRQPTSLDQDFARPFAETVQRLRLQQLEQFQQVQQTQPESKKTEPEPRHLPKRAPPPT